MYTKSPADHGIQINRFTAMKIAFITHNYPVSPQDRTNAGSFVFDLSHFLASKKHTVLVIVVNASDTKIDAYENGRLQVFYIGAGSIKKKLGKAKLYSPTDVLYVMRMLLASQQEITKILKRESIDFCLAFWAIPSGILASKVCRKLKIPYGIWALGSDIYMYQKIPVIKNLINSAVSHANVLLADGIKLSEEVSKITKKKCNFLPSATVFTQSDIQMVSMKKKLINFIFLGRMEHIKGPDILLSAIQNIEPKNFHVYFLGEGMLLEQLRQKSIKYGLEKHVTFTGNIHDKTILFSYLKHGDYLVIPSRGDSIPLVMSEGARAGIPLVVSDVGDMKYFVKKYQLGYVFESENIQQLQEILQLLVMKRKKEKAKFQSGLKEFRSQFDISAIADTLVASLKTL